MATPTTAVEPKSSVLILKQEQTQGESLGRLAMRRLRRDYMTLAAIVVLLIYGGLSLFAPVISDALDVSYRSISAQQKFGAVGEDGHPLGTDHLGRDYLARLLYGGRVSLSIGIVAALCSMVVGVTIGLLAGFYQGSKLGFVDDAIMWFVTTLNAIPSLMLLILLGSVLAPTKSVLIFTLTLISWSGTMRLVRGETLSQREREYVISARAVGATPFRLMFRHILPNVFSILIIALSISIGTLILTESALSFLGLGVRPPEPSWGNMLSEARNHFREAVHLSILPGLLISSTVLCLYVIGDGLRDAFDPQAKKHN